MRNEKSVNVCLFVCLLGFKDLERKKETVVPAWVQRGLGGELSIIGGDCELRFFAGFWSGVVAAVVFRVYITFSKT